MIMAVSQSKSGVKIEEGRTEVWGIRTQLWRTEGKRKEKEGGLFPAASEAHIAVG